MKKIIRILLLLPIIVLTSCGSIEDSNEQEINPKEPILDLETPILLDLPEVIIKTELEKQLDKMSLHEKIGQLFIVRPESLNLNHQNLGTRELQDEMREILRDYPPGGVVFFSENISSPEQITSFTKSLQEESKIPLLMAIDEEGGRVSRIARSPNFDVPKFESIENIGEMNDVSQAYNVGYVIGSYLKDYGFNLNFAPVADMNTNPENVVIGDRSFGSDPELVSKMILANINGLHDANVMSATKHFPGHGNTKGDTHLGYVSIEENWDELKERELIPFISSFDETDMVMISHIATPNITSDHLPASLSKEMIEGKLKKELGYNGIIISDAMEMEAITKEYSSKDAAVKGLLAGLDIILMPRDYMAAYQGILDAVENGEITEARINESVLKILKVKKQYQLDSY